jgi:hypothetical protein
MVPVSTFTYPITSAPPFGGAFFYRYYMTCLHRQRSFHRSLRQPTKKAPAREELRPKSREETPHNGVPSIWACNPPMPIKFEVSRHLAGVASCNLFFKKLWQIGGAGISAPDHGNTSAAKRVYSAGRRLRLRASILGGAL